jgi:hypothetical protein
MLQVSHHGVLIANQLGLIAEQLTEIDPDTPDGGGTTPEPLVMIDLTRRQLRDAPRAFTAASVVRRTEEAADAGRHQSQWRGCLVRRHSFTLRVCLGNGQSVRSAPFCLRS